MLTTISVATRISVQGELIAQLPSGELIVRDGEKLYRGLPVRARSEQGRTVPMMAQVAAA
jgi:hypothetical protein